MKQPPDLLRSWTTLSIWEPAAALPRTRELPQMWGKQMRMQQTRQQERNEWWSGGSFKQQATHNTTGSKYRLLDREHRGGGEAGEWAALTRSETATRGARGREDPGKLGPAGAALVFTSTSSSIHGGRERGRAVAARWWTGTVALDWWSRGGGTGESSGG